jgi:receptor protein-tyrosine kinase
MIGSAFAGAGKTFTALNLALSVSMELDHSVLLVDADVIKQTLSKELGFSGARGLIDALKDSTSDLSEFLVAVDGERLTFLPAGRHDTLANELLASDRMEQLVAELGGRDPNRLVIFDAPPLLETTEASVLANYMGQILLVAAVGETPHQALVRVVEGLDRSKAINVVLNKSERSLVSDYYGDYYGQYGDKPLETGPS